MAKLHVSTTINGEPEEFLCEFDETMLDVLRNGLGLTGSKEGCGNGNCGACTVALNGNVVNACLVFALEAGGADVTTIEGVAAEGHLHPLQQAFIEHGALQCGFCTPGFIMSATALLERNPNPTEREIRLAISGNLCRCTGYDKIIRAIQAVSDTLA